jgi:hypothetical protein
MFNVNSIILKLKGQTFIVRKKDPGTKDKFIENRSNLGIA